MSDENLGPSDGPPLPAGAAVAEDLRRIAAIRSPKALRDAEFPAIFALLDVDAEPDVRVDRIRRAITDALDSIPDPQFRAAARALFAFDDQRWTPLRKRGEVASSAFSCSFDAFRRARRSTGTSLLDETVEQLSRSLVDRRRAEVAVPAPGDDPDSSSPGGADGTLDREEAHSQEGRPRRRRLAMALGGIALLAVAVAVAVVALSDRNAPKQGRGAPVASATTAAPANAVHPTGAGCAHPIGQVERADLKPYRTPFITQIDQLTPPGQVAPCGAGPVTRWGRLVIQKLTDAGGAAGAIVAEDPDHVMVMTEAEYGSYRQIGGKDGTQAQSIEGLPRRRGTSPSGKAWLIYTDHGVLASQGVDQPGYYLGGPVWTRWKATGEDTGEMGMVASNPLNNAVGYYQDFAHGRLTLSYSGTLSFAPVADPASFLPKNAVGNILRHDDGTTWYIDHDRVRHWIPDGPTWQCLHERGATEIDHVPGYATLTLRLGKPATCATRK